MNCPLPVNCRFNLVPCSSVTPRFAHERTAWPFSSNSWSKLSVALIIWIVCGLAIVQSAMSQNVPTGTIELSGGSVAAAIGYTWGKGTLIYEGKKYPLKVNGLSIVHVGISNYTASGTVYDLQKVTDINGIYTAVSAGAAIAGGASVTAMKNSKGVLIQMVSTHAGLNFSLGPKGVEITLE
jgi:hypothetical protein